MSDQERLDVVKAQVAQQFGWTHIAWPNRQFFAWDADHRVLWLKARVVERESERTSWNWASSPQEFDALIGILASPSHEVLTVVRVAKPDVERLKHENAESWRLRWNRDTARDPGVEILWSRDGQPGHGTS